MNVIANSMLQWTRPLGHWSFSSNAGMSVSDQMIDYALRQCKGNASQGHDVLQSGLSLVAPDSIDAAKLLLARASLAADADERQHALDFAQQASKAVQGGRGNDVELLRSSTASVITTLALQGFEDQFTQSCAQAVQALQPGNTADSASTGNAANIQAVALCLATAHAAGQADNAMNESKALESVLDKHWAYAASQGANSSQGPLPAQVLGTALVTLADYKAALSIGTTPDEAQQLKQQAGALYTQAADIMATASQQGWPLLDETHAAALTGKAQLSVASENWDEAEEILGRALTAAESVTTDKHPRVVPVLCSLAYVYSRSARVTFAEGLLRETTKILRVDPVLHPNPTEITLPTAVHSSLTACAAWRYHQLLSAMPNRHREAASWAALATSAWSRTGSPFMSHKIDEVLGSADVLTGKGSKGTGSIISLLYRRLLPVKPSMIAL